MQQQKTIYLTAYSASAAHSPQPSQPLPGVPDIQQAVGMVGAGMPVLESFRRLVVLDLGGGQRLAVSDYRFA